jgi:iron complex transport system substrate-binding protein
VLAFRRRRASRFAWLALCTGLSIAHAAPFSVTDDRGVAARLERPAQRIVTLSPNLAEIAFAAGAGSAVVGVADFSDFPAQAKRLPVVASAAGIDLERLLALKPDLVLAWYSGNRVADLERIERLGIPVIATEPRRLVDVPRITRLIGRAAGTAPAAEAAAQDFEAELARLRRRYSGARELTVFYQVWERPLITIGGGHIIDEVIRFCGGRNIFADLKPLAPEVSLESVIAADPEAILIGGEANRDVSGWTRLTSLRAVADKRIYQIDPSRIERATPRLVEGIAEVCGKLDRARRSGSDADAAAGIQHRAGGQTGRRPALGLDAHGETRGGIQHGPELAGNLQHLILVRGDESHRHRRLVAPRQAPQFPRCVGRHFLMAHDLNPDRSPPAVPGHPRRRDPRLRLLVVHHDHHQGRFGRRGLGVQDDKEDGCQGSQDRRPAP